MVTSERRSSSSCGTSTDRVMGKSAQRHRHASHTYLGKPVVDPSSLFRLLLVLDKAKALLEIEQLSRAQLPLLNQLAALVVGTNVLRVHEAQLGALQVEDVNAIVAHAQKLADNRVELPADQGHVSE